MDGRDGLDETLRAHGVAFALLFGSHARGAANEHSDVDVAVMPTNRTDLWRLRGALGEDVDLVDLRTAPEYLAGRIALDGLVIVDDDEVARVRWQARTRLRYFDEAHRREQFTEDFRAAHG